MRKCPGACDLIYRIVARASIWLLAGLTALALAASLLGRWLPVAPPLVLPLGPAMNLDIYLIDSWRGIPADLTRNEWWDGEPALSPDGERVAFSSLMSGSSTIYIADLRSLSLHRLTEDDFFNGQPAWSPDGRQIVYASDRNIERSLYIMDVDSARVRRLTDAGGADFAPAWSPDGGRIAFSRVGSGDPGEIYVIGADGRGLQPFTDHRGIDIHPAWSPDGRWLAFASDRDGSLNVYIMATDCLETAQGCAVENPRQLTRWGVNPATLWWTDDGQHIRYWERVIGMPEIYALEADCDLLPGGCVPQRLTNLRYSLALRR